jgi:hypothetical protein
VIGDGLVDELQDLRFNGIGRWQDVAGEAEGAFHDEGIGWHPCGGRYAAGGAEFVIAGVEEAGAVMGIEDMEHARTGDVTGGEEGEEKLFPGQGLVEIDDEQSITRDAVSRLQEMGRDGAAEDLLVSCDVIGMSVRDEGLRLGVARIEPEVGIGEMQFLSGAETDFVG